VLSDLAPKTSGVRSADEARSPTWPKSARALAGGAKGVGFFVVKVFMAATSSRSSKRCRQAFSQVRVVRPEASVARGSKEVYLVCREPRPITESSAASDGSTPESRVGPEGS